MENIFEGAKFGDKYVTRDGRIAIFWRVEDSCYFDCTNPKPSVKATLILDGNLNKGCATEVSYYTGRVSIYDTEDWDNNDDIVSRYQEEIDEEKLDELAEEFYSNVEQKALKNGQVDDWGEAYIFSYNVTDAYKAGFYKAKEG